MDPLSFAASLLAIVTAAQSGVAGLRKLSSYRNSPREIEELTSELDRLHAVLKDVQSFVQLHPGTLYDCRLSVCTQSAGSKIAEVHNLLAAKPFRLSSLSDTNRSRAVWIRHKHRLTALRDDLRVVRIDIAVGLDLMAVYGASIYFPFQDYVHEYDRMLMSLCRKASSRLELALDVSKCAQDRMSDQLNTILQTVASISTIHTGFRNQALLEGQNDELAPGLDSQSQFRWPNNLEATSAEAPSPQPDWEQGPIGESAVMTPVKQCAAWCSCACHTYKSFRSPWVLKPLIGDIGIHYNAPRIACNEVRCQQSRGSTLRLTYYLPRYLMSRYIALAMRSTQLGEPQIFLRMPRIVDWSHPLWNYARNGNLLAIQRLISEGKASPFDVNLHGSNALIYRHATAVLHWTAALQWANIFCNKAQILISRIGLAKLPLNCSGSVLLQGNMVQKA